MSSSWICVDASLVIRLVADPADRSTHRLFEGWSAENQCIAAPTLLYYEVTNAFHQYQRHGLLTGASEQEAVNLGWAHGALLTTFPGDTTMATLEQVRAFAQGGSARIQR